MQDSFVELVSVIGDEIRLFWGSQQPGGLRRVPPTMAAVKGSQCPAR